MKENVCVKFLFQMLCFKAMKIKAIFWRQQKILSIKMK